MGVISLETVSVPMAATWLGGGTNKKGLLLGVSNEARLHSNFSFLQVKRLARTRLRVQASSC